MTNPIIQAINEAGIDHARLKVALDSKDRWGELVHSFEYLTVLAIVEHAMCKADEYDELERRLADDSYTNLVAAIKQALDLSHGSDHAWIPGASIHILTDELDRQGVPWRA